MKIVAAILALSLLVACGEPAAKVPAPVAKSPAAGAPVAMGNPEQGKQLMGQYGCNVCHTVPGLEGPQGTIGPSLDGVATRPTISQGAVQNTPANLVKFVQDPSALNPQTSMPPSGLSPADAAHVAAYLTTLK